MIPKTPFKRVAGLGSARKGTEHFYRQRLTALALIFLISFFIYTVMRFANADHAALIDWLAHPVVTTLMVLLVVVVTLHAQLGIRVIIEDYIHHENLKIMSLIGSTFALIILALMGVIALLSICFGS